MIDSGFDEIFAELIDEQQPRELFLETLARLVPGGGLLLVMADGGRLRRGEPFALDSETEAVLSRALAEAPAAVAAHRLADAWLYALAVEELAAILFWRLPGEHDLSRQPAAAALLHLALRYALREEERQEAAAQKEQHLRQIEVLKRQHVELIEDNFRQYRINQEREQEYARNLESEIARQTAELRQANLRLEESSRLKSAFLANMSHELRTPMNAIIGFAELLADTALSGEQDEYCRTIRQAAASLLALINDILDMAKIEAGKLDLELIPFELDKLLDGAAAMFALAAKAKGLKLTVRRDPGLPPRLRGDSHRLRQVLVNLLGNAVKFTEKGQIELEVGRPAGAAVAASPAERVALRFEVRDSGIGIPADRLQAVFENFTQADDSTTRRFGGTGLGLAICRQLVELMGGQIGVRSQAGAGSTFSFEIELGVAPAAAAAAEQPPPAVAVTAAAAAGQILLVEDNPVNQRLASLMIGRQGYRTVVAADGLEALERLREQSFELVFMDVQMPRMDGMSATRRIRELEGDPVARAEYAALAGRAAPLPIVGLTAHARREDEEACYAAGMNAFLSKPIVRDRLIAILAELAPPAGPA